MTDYPLSVDEIASWFRSMEEVANARAVTVAGIHERHDTCKPAAFADFDADGRMGRVCVWVSGEIDFEVVRISDGEGVLFHHEKVSTLADQALDRAFDAFLKGMTNPDRDLLTL
jgi:hypothetical protein